jgi:hypothetical protein
MEARCTNFGRLRAGSEGFSMPRAMEKAGIRTWLRDRRAWAEMVKLQEAPILLLHLASAPERLSHALTAMCPLLNPNDFEDGEFAVVDATTRTVVGFGLRWRGGVRYFVSSDGLNATWGYEPPLRSAADEAPLRVLGPFLRPVLSFLMGNLPDFWAVEAVLPNQVSKSDLEQALEDGPDEDGNYPVPDDSGATWDEEEIHEFLNSFESAEEDVRECSWVFQAYFPNVDWWKRYA